MSELYHTEETPQYICWDRANYANFEDQLLAIKNSKTVYVGNLSFFTKESQIIETFSAAGPVKRIIMGLNNFSKTPCGFCFIEYYHQEHTYNAIKYLTETICDERLFRCDADGGFLQGRQFGRGKSGGQIRDERRFDYDPARGRFIPPSILGQNRYRDFRGGNNNRGGGGGGGFQKRTYSRDQDEGNYDRRGGGGGNNYSGGHKRARRNDEGNYQSNDGRYRDRQYEGEADRGDDDERDYEDRPRKHQYQRRNNNYDPNQSYGNRHYGGGRGGGFQRQNSDDMEVSINNSLETPRN